MKKVSFDFDGTLEFQDIQDYAKKLIDHGVEVHITTSRYENLDDYLPIRWKDGHNDLLGVAKKLGIPRKNIHFTNFVDKSECFKQHSCDDFRDFVWHLDDDFMEVKGIETNTKVKGVYSLGNGWRRDCNNLLEIEELTED